MITIELEPNRLVQGDNRVSLIIHNVSTLVCRGLTIRPRPGNNLFIDNNPPLTFARLDPGHTCREVVTMSAVRVGSAKLILRCSWSDEYGRAGQDDKSFTLDVGEQEPKPRPATKEPPPASKQAPTSIQEDSRPAAQPAASPRTPFRVQLLQRIPGRMEIRGLTVPGGGQPKKEVAWPFSPNNLKAVLKALDRGELSLEGLKNDYIQSLQKLNLVSGSRLSSDFHRLVGQRLYQALFSSELLTEFTIARRAAGSLSCQLCFDPEDVILAQFPWELIHDDNTHLVPGKGGIELTRYITFATPPSPLKTKLPLKILLINPRPTDDTALPDRLEQEALLAGLEALHQEGQIVIKILDHPTWGSLEDCLNNETFAIIHFDGHGSFARICPNCQTAHYPDEQICAKCKSDMNDITPEGYLHFEDNQHRLDRISATDLKTVLTNSQTRLMVLTACASGVVQGVSIFNSVAPGLIQAGVPAIVAMQGSPLVEIAVKFVKRFYESLAKGYSIPEAVNRGRSAIFRDKPVSWFMPVVYLRSSDESYGQLFHL